MLPGLAWYFLFGYYLFIWSLPGASEGRFDVIDGTEREVSDQISSINDEVGSITKETVVSLGLGGQYVSLEIV